MRPPLVIVLACAIALGCEEKSKKPVPLSQQTPAPESAAPRPQAPPTTPAEQPGADKPAPALAVDPGQSNSGIAASNLLGFSISRDKVEQLKFEGRGGGLAITDGEESFARAPGATGIDRVATPDDGAIVQVDLSLDPKRSLLGKSVRSAQMVVQPFVVDADGTLYECVGFIYEESETVWVRYTPDQPIRGLSDVPDVSANQPGQRLRLLFAARRGAQITRLQLGTKIIAEFSPAVSCDQEQR